MRPSSTPVPRFWTGAAPLSTGYLCLNTRPEPSTSDPMAVPLLMSAAQHAQVFRFALIFADPVLDSRCPYLIAARIAPARGVLWAHEIVLRHRRNGLSKARRGGC